jgi:hypothetical protein
VIDHVEATSYSESDCPEAGYTGVVVYSEDGRSGLGRGRTGIGFGRFVADRFEIDRVEVDRAELRSGLDSDRGCELD